MESKGNETRGSGEGDKVVNEFLVAREDEEVNEFLVARETKLINTSFG